MEKNTLKNASGKIGENFAVDFLKKKKFKIIETNWHYSRVGEIDIIAMDGKNLVFIEVKTRKSTNFGHPMEAINAKKIEKLRASAMAFVQENKTIKAKGFRFDAVSVLLKKNGAEIEHFENAF